MKRRIRNLVFGILLLVLLAITFGFTIATVGMPGTRQMIFGAGVFLFAISRIIMFASPDSAIIKPMRAIALISCIAAFLFKG
jgi:hypothetical protein